MNPQAIFLPVCAQVLLTFSVLGVLGRARKKEIQANHIKMRDLADPEKFPELLKGSMNTSDNFENLFEMPVLFYALAIIVYVLGRVDVFYVFGATFFFVTRVLHSWIHCTTNRVKYRFLAYCVGTFVLLAMWLRLTVQLIQA